eukprot:COSAG06_NODE_9829_length_1808_cov_1.409011_2_plen_259_part_00
MTRLFVALATLSTPRSRRSRPLVPSLATPSPLRIAMAYAREFPRGPRGYLDVTRRNAIIASAAPRPTLQSYVDTMVPSARTLRRWKKQVRELGHPNRRGIRGHRKLKLSRGGAFVIWWYKHVRPSATYLEVRRFVQVCVGELISAPQLSRELKRLGFSRMRLQRQSRNRDEADRVRWWTNAPNAALVNDRGVSGLDPALLIDIDEKGLWLHEANRAYGHAITGQRAQQEDAIVRAVTVQRASPLRCCCAALRSHADWL